MEVLLLIPAIPELQKELQRQHDEILSFADLYDSAGIEAKKMVVSAMIRRVEVSRDYKLKIFFNFNLDQFLHGLDCGGTIQAGGCKREVCMQG